MAKVTGPLHSSEARGRMGGIIANTWRGASYVKAKTSPAQPRSKLQLQIRAWTTMLVRAWGELNQSQRDSWNEYATAHPGVDWTGNPKRLTGLNWWVRCNLRSLQMGLSGFVSVPTTAAPDALTNFAAANGVLSSVLTWTATGGTDKRVDIYIVGPHSAGMLAKIERAKHKIFASGETGTETIADLIAGTYTFFVRVLDEDNGLASPWVSDTAVVTAA
jgi:hypothetical protein